MVKILTSNKGVISTPLILGLVLILLFLTVLYFGPLNGSKQFGLLFQKKQQEQPTEAAKKGGNIRGTITLDTQNPVYGQAVTFSVSTNARGNDVYNLWVANKCSQGGDAVYVAHLPVQSGKAGPFTLNWTGGGTASCTAYVWFFPYSETPITGATINYSVSVQ